MDDKKNRRAIKNLADLLNMPNFSVEVIKEKVANHKRKFEPIEIVKIPWGKESTELISRLEENVNCYPVST